MVVMIVVNEVGEVFVQLDLRAARGVQALVKDFEVVFRREDFC